LDDAETNRHYKLFKGYNAASRWINVIPLAYIIYTANQKLYSNNEYWAVYLISTGGSIAFNLLERAQIKKAITRYNLRVERNKLGLSIQPLPHQTSALGIGFSRSF
jgi:hypothetical protein